MLNAMARMAGPIPRWVTFTAIGQWVGAFLVGCVLFSEVIIGYLPLGTYDTRIIEQGNIVGYLLLWLAVLWVSTCLLAAGLGASRLRSGGLLAGRGLWVSMLVGGISCALIGASIESTVWQDLSSGPVTLRGTVTAAYSSNEHKMDTKGRNFIVTTYHVTIGGQTFSSSADGLADVFKRATVGRCAAVSYGRHSHELVDLTSCPTR
jgi:hypothetical protein